MAKLQVCTFALVVLNSCALRSSRDVAGDQPPQIYPAVTVHVPEPAGGALGSEAMADAFTDGVASLRALERRLDAQERAVLFSFEQLDRQIQSLSEAVGAATQ